MVNHNSQKDKYVTFKSGDEYFGLKIEYVNEIIVFQEITEVPESEDYMKNLADRLNLDMNELMASSNSVSITTAAVMTALNYRDELEKASGSADNMRRQIKDYLEDAASAKMAAEEARRENASLKRRVDELERRLRRNQFPAEDE